MCGENLNLISGMKMLRIGEEIIDDDIIWSLKWPAFQIAERIAQGIKAVELDSPDRLDGIVTYLQNRRRHHLHVLHLSQHIRILDRHRSAAQTPDHRRPWRTHHRISPDCSCALFV